MTLQIPSQNSNHRTFSSKLLLVLRPTISNNTNNLIWTRMLAVACFIVVTIMVLVWDNNPCLPPLSGLCNRNISDSKLSTISSVFSDKEKYQIADNGWKRLQYTLRAIEDVTWRPNDVLLISHRGCIGRFPENTLAAIAACTEEGAHMAEIDVEMTADKHLVLMHDSFPDRTTNRKQWVQTTPVSNLTLNELQTQYWVVQNEYTGVLTNFRIPTFIDALRVAKFCGIQLYVDTKGRDYVMEAVAKDIQEADAHDVALVIKLPAKSYPSQIRYIVPVYSSEAAQNHINDVDVLHNASQDILYPNGDFRKHSSETCKLRMDNKTSTLVSTLWDKAEYYLRDPVQFQDYVKKTFNANNEKDDSLRLQAVFDNITHNPCPKTPDSEDPCLGAHVYQSLSALTCARVIITDQPSTARSALHANNQIAPLDVYPTESIPITTTTSTTTGKYRNKSLQSNTDVSYQRLAKIPKCLELWEQQQH